MNKILMVLAMVSVVSTAAWSDDDDSTAVSACANTSANPYAKLDKILKENFNDVSVPEPVSDSDTAASSAVSNCIKMTSLRYHKMVTQIKTIDLDKNAKLCSLSASINSSDSSQVNRDHLEQLWSTANSLHTRYSALQPVLTDITTDNDALDSLNEYCSSRCSVRDGYGKRDVAGNAKYAPILKNMNHPCYELFGGLRAYISDQSVATENMADGTYATIQQLTGLSAGKVTAPVSSTLAVPSADSPSATAASTASAPVTSQATAAKLAAPISSDVTPITAPVKVDTVQDITGSGTSTAPNIFKSNSSSTSALCKQNPNLMGCSK